jgi:hypothetical protein
MTLVAFVIALIVTIAVGKVLIRFLGWPANLAAVKRWGIVLLGLAVFFSGLPELVHTFGARFGPMQSVELTDLVPALCILGLAILGYLGSARAAEERERQAQADERTHFMPRKRAAPLPPHQGVGAAPGQVFNPVGDDNGNAEAD